MQPTSTGHKLQELRKLMAARNLQAFLVPSEDAHQAKSEYIAEWDARREFISGFTGSAGFAIVTSNEAALWTDGRYFLQAEKQLDSNWKLMKAGIPGTATREEYLASKLQAGEQVGVDAQTISHDSAVKLAEALQRSKIRLNLMEDNLVDLIWTERPEKQLKPVFHLSNEFCGMGMAEKIASLQKSLSPHRAFLVTALDEVAWLFNLRGSDISCNPCFFSYALVEGGSSSGQVKLYMHASNLTPDALAHLERGGVKIRPYKAIFDDLSALRSELEKTGEKILISGTCNAALVERVGAENVVSQRSPVEKAKAVKNEVEQEGLRKCHIRDAAALVRYFAWLEAQLASGAEVDEIEGSDRLETLRAENEHFRGLSFDTISGSGPNGAVIHYKANRAAGNVRRISTRELYLCDSGAQYLDGTTDVTRTVHFGEPTAEEKDSFTRVLLGNITLDRVVFPAGTTGFMLDSLARMHLWQVGLDYRHGTGHGVGHFLNVHEGPHSISFHPRSNETPLLAGMTVTNEPGFYLDGKFGIRIENVLLVHPASTRHNFGGTQFLRFENITMVPIQTKLMDLSLMTEKDIEWVNAHHDKCWQRVSPLLQHDQQALEWLRRETRPIAK